MSLIQKIKRKKEGKVPRCNNFLLFFQNRIHPGYQHRLGRHNPDVDVFRYVQFILFFCNNSGACGKAGPTIGSALSPAGPQSLVFKLLMLDVDK